MVEVHTLEHRLRTRVDARVSALALKHIADYVINVGEALVGARRRRACFGKEMKPLPSAYEVIPARRALVEGASSPRIRIEIAEDNVLRPVGGRRPVAEVDKDLLDLFNSASLIRWSEA